MSEVSQELIGRCRLGDEAGWEELFAMTYPLSRWAVRHTIFNCSADMVEELAQETMVSLAKSIGKIEDPAHLRNFVVRVTRNRCLNYMKKKRELFVEVPETIPDDKDLLDDINDKARDAIGVLREAVTVLKEPCRAIVRDRFLEGCSHKAIADRNRIDIKQIGVRLKRCLGLLKRMLEDKNITLEDVA